MAVTLLHYRAEGVNPTAVATECIIPRAPGKGCL
jgi:hypothetical protein